MNVKAILTVMMIAVMMTGTVSAAAPSGVTVQDTTDVFGKETPADDTDDGSNSDESNDNTTEDNTDQEQDDQQQEPVTVTPNGDTVVVEINNTNTNVNNNDNVNVNDNLNNAQANAVGFMLEFLSSELGQELLSQLDITADGSLTIEIEA